MSNVEWQIAYPTGDLVVTYRGIRIVIKRRETGNPLEIGSYIGGKEVESIPLDCDEEKPKGSALSFSVNAWAQNRPDQRGSGDFPKTAVRIALSKSITSVTVDEAGGSGS